MTELLLEAAGVEKRYGAVTALRDASLSVRPGEIHALMGANGAGKSTLVKILTGAVKPDAGTIRLRGQDRAVHSPAEARRTGMVSVYQEPAIIPDLTIAENLVLTETPSTRSGSASPISAFPASTSASRLGTCRSPRCESLTWHVPLPLSRTCCSSTR